MREKWFGTRAFWQSALRLALPIGLQNLLVSSFSLVDTIMVGQLGEVPLAAVGMAGQWVWLLNIALFGISSGGAVFIAQYWGAKDRDGIARTYGTILAGAIALALLFTLVAAIFPQWILSLFTNDAVVIEEGTRYLEWACISYVGVALSLALSTVLRSTEQVRLPAFASFISVSCNAVFNYILIFGKLGLPAMGVAGAAIATAISSWVNPIVLFLVSWRRKNILIVPVKKMFAVSGRFIRDFLTVSFPVFINESLWALGTVGYNMVYGHMGTGNYSALTIFRTVESIAFSFFVGLCHASAVMIGKSIGAGDLREAQSHSRRFCFVFPFVSLAVGALIILLREPIIGLFSLTDTVRHTAIMLLVIYGLDIWLRNIPYICIVGIFRAGGDTRTGMVYDILCVWGIALPLTIVLGLIVKLPFLWVFVIMLLSEDIVKSILCLLRLKSDKWIRPVTEEGKRMLKEMQSNARKS